MNNITLKLRTVYVGSGANWGEGRRVPHSPNVSDKMHWTLRANWKKAWEAEVAAVCLENYRSLREAKGKATTGLPEVRVDLYSIQPMDQDNSYRSIKPLLDGLVKAGVIANDRRKDIKLNVEGVEVEHKADEHVEITLTF